MSQGVNPHTRRSILVTEPFTVDAGTPATPGGAKPALMGLSTGIICWIVALIAVPFP